LARTCAKSLPLLGGVDFGQTNPDGFALDENIDRVAIDHPNYFAGVGLGDSGVGEESKQQYCRKTDE
jgi:hypothetical protein